MIWVLGVRPDSLQGEDAHHSGEEILQLLESHGIVDVDVEYREFIYKRLIGPALLRSVSNFEHHCRRSRSPHSRSRATHRCL